MHCRERERVFRFLCSALAFFVSINWFFAQPAQGLASDAQLQAQKEAYQEKIAAADSRLRELKDEKDRAQDYCDLLEQKITYLQEELALCEQEVENAKNDIAAINNRIINNENSVKTIEKRSESVKIQIDALTETLASVYDEWCARMRAAYISGRYTLLELLLTSDGPAALLTRLEMISAVSRHDGKIMQTVSSSIDKITALQAQLQTDAAKLQAASEQLRADEAARKKKRSDYLALEEELAARHAALGAEHGFAAQISGYPGWPADRDNPLASLLERVWREQTGRTLELTAVHVGLEPSVLRAKAPGLVMASTGPDILDAHSVDERAPLAGLADYALLLAGAMEAL